MENIAEWLYNYIGRLLSPEEEQGCPCLKCNEAKESPSACTCQRLSVWLSIKHIKKL